MSRAISRRTLLKNSTLAAAATAAAGTGLFPSPCVWADPAGPAKLRMVLIGCGNRGRAAHLPVIARERLVALVDPNQESLDKTMQALDKNAEKWGVASAEIGKVRRFADYRKLYDEMHNEIDAVVVATPDHQHACPTMMAIKHGKHVYCEKPLTHDIFEAQALADAARSAKVATQMGNQGLATDGDRRLAEYLAAGAIGTVREVHGWHGWPDRFGGIVARPEIVPPPKTLDWNLWVGPASVRDYPIGMHGGWWGAWDFGTGSLGGWSTHVLDAACFALKLDRPTRVELLEADDISDDRYPARARIRYDFPARGQRAAVQVFWHDGSLPHPRKDAVDAQGKPARVPYFAPLARELETKYGVKFANAGAIYVGDKGMLYAASHGAAPKLLPAERDKDYTPPEETLPRIEGGIHADFLRACKTGGEPPCSNFADFAGPFIKWLLTGHLAIKAGVGNPIEWENVAMKCTNRPEINRWVRRDYRSGWSL